MIQTMLYASIFADGYLLSSASLININLFLYSYYVYTEDAENNIKTLGPILEEFKVWDYKIRSCHLTI